jgi:hypothetical protein
MRVFHGMALAGLLALGAASLADEAVREPAPPRAVQEKDFRTFLAWFEGEFDSNEQVAFADELGIPKEAVPERIHSIFKRVDLPAFGEHVFYVEQYLDGDPAKIYRQRLYSFSLDDAEQAIRLVIHIPADAKALVGAHRDPSKLAGLTPAAMRSPPGCEVYWRRRGDAFIGSMKPGACRIVSQRSGKTIVVSDDLYLDEDEIWIHDRAVDEQGGYVYGNKAGIPNKLRKVSWFACWLSVRREGVADDDPKAWSFDRNIAMHDGGELVWVKTDARAARVGLKIRRPVWPSGPNQDSLVLYVHDEAADEPARAASYGWADPGAQRLGINLRWMQASCSQRPSRDAASPAATSR